ncbi:Microtubule associated protein [Spironucleus salmonicida]|uniref:Microtubule associated protein n=1 Tax=Spironucleus salmonicida TaxID=348837 RepID=V6LTX3_9EUKA|nr:Microtubule associated protein [Spironucleus salmonicida]|eukprot:EST48055.1 hypothetical protein SS50377_11821 [Spironucleus salmonicida]
MQSLPDVVQTISDALSSANRIWHVIALPENDQISHTTQFFDNIVQLTQDFTSSQIRFEQILNEQIKDKTNLLNEVATALSADFQITATQKYAQLIQINKFQALFEEEFNQRTEKLTMLTQTLQLLLIDAEEQFVIETSLKLENLTLLESKINQLETLLKPKQLVLQNLQKELNYFVGMFQRKFQPDSFASRIIIQNLQQQGRVCQISELAIIIQEFKSELEVRIQDVKQQIQQLFRYQQILQNCSEFLVDSSVVEIGNRSNFLVLDGDYTDSFVQKLRLELSSVQEILYKNNDKIILGLIQMKTNLISTFHSNYVNYQTSGDIETLMGEIQEVQILQKLIQPIGESIQKYREYKAFKNELSTIQKDSSRFTSKSRDASKMRQREEILKKELVSNFPKAIADLKFKVDQLKIRIQELGIKINASEIFGVDYTAELGQVLQQNDKAFTLRYEKFYQFYSKNSTISARKVNNLSATNYIKTPNIQRTPGRGTPGKATPGRTTPGKAGLSKTTTLSSSRVASSRIGKISFQ